MGESVRQTTQFSFATLIFSPYLLLWFPLGFIEPLSLSLYLAFSNSLWLPFGFVDLPFCSLLDSLISL